MSIDSLPSRAEGSAMIGREAQYKEVVNRCRALIDVLPETDELEYREQPANSPELRAMARLELVRDALLAEADVHAEKGEMYAERAARMLVQLKEAEATIVGIYLDARQDSADVAGLVEEMFPWVRGQLKAVNDEAYEVDTQNAA